MKRTLLLAILLLALALRTYALGSQSLWYDEAVTARVAGQGIAELTRWTADDIQPPLYYYIMAGWTRVAGNSEWALRFPSAFFGVLTVALMCTAGRRLLSRNAGLLAAVFAALSALYIYYGQEARMYALLTFLGLLAGYTLLRAWSSRTRERLGWWVAFVAASTAMLYTHYFGAFLLLAYALCVVAGALLAARRGDPAERRANRSRVLAAALAFLAVVLLYVPWLPAMLNRYEADASYWAGQLKLGEALRHLAISLVAGAPETMLEAHAVRAALVVAAALLLAGTAALLERRKGRGYKASDAGRDAKRGIPASGAAGPFAVLLATLFVPAIAVLVLVSRTPKFNPRYLMLVSPAFFLLVAGLVDWLWDRRSPVTRLPAVVVFLSVLLPSLLGIRNWFTSPLFTKAQWREAAAYVQEHIAADEAVVLVSGHAEPAWSYYASQLPPVRLPAIDILDVNAVLGFEDAPALDAGLLRKRGAWLVTWQDEVVDPMQTVPLLLDREGKEQPVDGQFWHVGVRHWRLSGNAAFPAEPRPDHPDSANYDHKLALLGWDEPRNGELTVYWQALNTLTKDYQVSLVLEDGAGKEVGRWDGRPAGYGYPATRWQPGEAVVGRYPLPLPSTAGPGPYFASLAVYDPVAPQGLDIRDVADNPAGKRVLLGPIHVEK